MKYLITVKIPIEAMDDLEARKITNDLKDHYILLRTKDNEVKLQEIVENAPPRGIRL